MAQTIALQRGTATVSGDGSTFVTLFTQAGGTATRVIVNQLTMSFSAQLSTSSNACLYLTSSGGQSSVLGIMSRGDTGSQYATQFPAGSSNDNAWFGGTAGTTGNCLSLSPMIQQTGTSGDMSAGNCSSVNLSYSGPSVSRFAVLPQNFYIGPSDVLKMKVRAQTISGKSTVNQTATLSWSFTTITES